MAESQVNPPPAETDEPLEDRARRLAGDAGNELLDRANETGARGFRSMGQKLDEAADYVRTRGPEAARRLHVDDEHVDRVAGSMHGAADYLRSHDPRSVLGDVDRAIQKHPYRALMVGAVVGYAIGRLFRRD